MKKLIITVVDGLHYRYLIETKVIHSLVPKASKILILTIPSLVEKAKSAFDASNVEVRAIEPVKLTFFRKLFLLFKEYSNRNLSETVNLKNEIRKQQKRGVHLLGRTVQSMAGSFLHRIIEVQLRRSFRSKPYRALLRQFSPDLVVFSTPGQKILDVPLLFETKKLAIPTISPVYSWDNLSGKGPFLINVDRLIVWNRIMKAEASFFHQYKSENIDAVGVPVFDAYPRVKGESPEMKERFLTQLNLSSNLNTITVTTIPRVFFGGCHNEIIKKLVGFMRSKRIPECNILIRPHPKDDTDYSHWKDYKNITLDYYGTQPDDSLVNWVPTDDNTVHLARTMKYSDIVINIASTITIDAACFDTPVINIAYDMKDNESEYVGSILRYYSYTHYQNVVKVGAARIVRSDDDFVEAINSYLQDRTKDSRERQMLVAEQAGVLDGKAHERIAQSILNRCENS